MTRRVYAFGNNVTGALDPTQDAPKIIFKPRLVHGVREIVWAGWSKSVVIDDEGRTVTRGSELSVDTSRPLATGYDDVLGSLLDDGSLQTTDGILSKTSGWKQVVALGTGEIYALTTADSTLHRYRDLDEFVKATCCPPAIPLPRLPKPEATKMFAGPSNLVLLHPQAVLASGDTRYNVTCARTTKGFDAEPRILEHLEGLNVVSITMGGCRAGAVSDAGDAFIWGKDLEGIEQIELDDEPADVKFLGLGSDFDVFVTDSDQVWVRGNNRFGQLGFERDVSSVADFTRLTLPVEGQVTGLTVSRWAAFITVDTESDT